MAGVYDSGLDYRISRAGCGVVGMAMVLTLCRRLSEPLQILQQLVAVPGDDGGGNTVSRLVTGQVKLVRNGAALTGHVNRAGQILAAIQPAKVHLEEKRRK